MKQFEVPAFYRSQIISKVKAQRKLADPRKKDFSPTELQLGKVTFVIARHFGFCYGVENAIEKSYKAIHENPGKRIFLLSQMIHNPAVNEDLISHGLQFLQDTEGNQLIPFDTLTKEDLVIIPAFGTTLEIEDKLKVIGVDIATYNTTCPFVEKVWNRSEKLGETNHTIIIHGKHKHEETRATFSHSSKNAPSLIVKDIEEAKILGDYILGKIDFASFEAVFKGKSSPGFDPIKDLAKIGVVNQTTMLARETQEIALYLREVMLLKYGTEEIKEHIADTRDTLCYATNDNQTATLALMETSADMAIVVGGYNSSNTSHLVELLEQKFPCYFIKDESEIRSKEQIRSFDIHSKSINDSTFLSTESNQRIILTSGASCPDSIVDGVMMKILSFFHNEEELNTILSTMK
ncbi:MAG: 4-hydroxy-3-methylbut-2-enyl diphosphate reductase [Crocinitomicaceae bacterium]|nr:4-hydroxy-3-methylbut-2-enyl diphosphate reductase [Crocinitomicaceae bacterium]MBP6032881.1 4-hydroxy-3-methylbut-2-enyl diphosphate reductase [Crocinitomicaceae bacterium]